MKSLSITIALIIILILGFILKSSLIPCRQNFSNQINQNNSTVSVQDFTKQAIRGEKGDLGLHMLEKSGQLSLGYYDDGRSGGDKDQEVQLLLAGKHNSGSNNGRKGHTTYKLKIDGYDNDGSIVYPIYSIDENKNIDFYIKNRSSPGSKPEMMFAGNFILNGINVQHHLMPKGTIVAFNGKTPIPYGWAICNGSNTTPNLRGRFILGESLSKKINTTGGLEKVQLSINHLPKHNHSMNNSGNHSHFGNTNDAGVHTHRISQLNRQGNPDGWNDSGRHYWRNNDYHLNRTTDQGKNVDNSGNHNHTFKTQNSGNHNHYINYSGESHSHENMPPYYVLIYIMKII